MVNHAEISAESIAPLMSQGCSAHSAVRLLLQFNRVRLGSSSVIRGVNVVEAVGKCEWCHRTVTDADFRLSTFGKWHYHTACYNESREGIEQEESEAGRYDFEERY